MTDTPNGGHAPPGDYHIAEQGVKRVLALIANDSWAISFQTLGQYRTALLDAIQLEITPTRAPDQWTRFPNE